MSAESSSSGDWRQRRFAVSVSATHHQTLRWKSEFSCGGDQSPLLIPICGAVIAKELQAHAVLHKRYQRSQRRDWAAAKVHCNRSLRRKKDRTGARRNLHTEWEWPLGEPDKVTSSRGKRVVIGGETDSSDESNDSSSSESSDSRGENEEMDDDDDDNDDNASVTSVQLEESATQKLHLRDNYFAEKRAQEIEEAEKLQREEDEKTAQKEAAAQRRTELKERHLARKRVLKERLAAVDRTDEQMHFDSRWDVEEQRANKLMWSVMGERSNP